jgi:hypothetical protein
MKAAALTTLILAAILVVCGLFPCLGAVNWVAGPFCAVPVLLGVVGLAKGKETGTQDSVNQGPYLAAIIGGLLLGGISAFRCLLGGGVV